MHDDLYLAFAERYRGSRDLVKSRLGVYLPFVEPLQFIDRDCSAVDLGCGRGEWLELLQGMGIQAFGVDVNEDMIAVCRNLGLAAERADALGYLKRLPDASVAIVSGFHLAEHVHFDDLQAMVREALRALKPAGLLILETPNTENILVGTSHFYLDPTHHKPIPPLLLSFLPEHIGFERTKILRLQEPSGLAKSESIRLLDVLSGVSPDVAVVAQKAVAIPAHAALFDPAFDRSYGLELETVTAWYDAGILDKLAGLSSRVEELLQAHDQLNKILASTSWRLTEPLRALVNAARSIRDMFR